VVRTRLVLFAAALAFAAVPVQGATAAGTCNAKQVVVARDYKVVRLTASHVSCAKARAAASTVARQLGRQGSVDIPGVAGFSMSTQMCTGCGTKAQVSLTATRPAAR